MTDGPQEWTESLVLPDGTVYEVSTLRNVVIHTTDKQRIVIQRADLYDVLVWLTGQYRRQERERRSREM